MSGVCAQCGLVSCACRTGQTVVTAAGATATEGRATAEAYLGRRGWSGTLIGVRRRRTRIGMIGYKAWDFRFQVRRDA